MTAAKGVGPELQFAILKLLKDVLCVNEGENVVVTTDGNADADVAKALQIGAHLLGAKPVLVVLDPPLPLQGLLADPFIPEPVLAAVERADLWFDLTMPYLAGSKAFDLVMQQGRGRYFLGAGLNTQAAIRLYGRIDLNALFSLCDSFQQVFDSAGGNDIRITSPAGTDVTFQTLQIPKTDAFQITRATRPGGYFPPGVAAFVPDPRTVKGTIVIEAVLHDYYAVLPEPISLELDGKIQSAKGGGTEFPAMDRALRRAANGGYGDIVHFSCGMHTEARFTGTSFHEDTRVVGTNAVGFGLPPGTPGGGENHPDGVIRNQSIWIGDEQIVDNGTVCAPPAITRALKALQPIHR